MKSTEPLPRPSRPVPGLPQAIDYFLFKALARRPEDRYASMGEMVAMLEGMASGIPPKTITLPTQSSERSNRSLWWVLVSGLGLICLLGAGSYLLFIH